MSTITPFGAAPAVPPAVLIGDLKLSLNDLGYDTPIATWLNTLGANAKRRATIFLQERQSLRRDAAILQTIVAAGVLTDAQIDAAFQGALNYAFQ